MPSAMATKQAEKPVQEKVDPPMPCELEGCVYVVHRDGGMPLWFAVLRLQQHQLNHVPHVTQPVQRARGVPVDEQIPAAVTQPVQRAQGVSALPCELVRGGGRCTTSHTGK